MCDNFSRQSVFSAQIFVFFIPNWVLKNTLPKNGNSRLSVSPDHDSHKMMFQEYVVFAENMKVCLEEKNKCHQSSSSSQGLAGVSLCASGAQLGRIGGDHFSWHTHCIIIYIYPHHHHHNHNDDRARPPWASARNWTRKSEPEVFARFDTIRNFTPTLLAVHCLYMEIQRSTISAMLFQHNQQFQSPSHHSCNI